MRLPETMSERIERKYLQKRIACQRAEIRRLLVIEEMYWKRVYADRDARLATPKEPTND